MAPICAKEMETSFIDKSVSEPFNQLRGENEYENPQKKKVKTT